MSMTDPIADLLTRIRNAQAAGKPTVTVGTSKLKQAILKVLRRLFPGANPDLEVADALSRLGSARVAAPYGATA